MIDEPDVPEELGSPTSAATAVEAGAPGPGGWQPEGAGAPGKRAGRAGAPPGRDEETAEGPGTAVPPGPVSIAGARKAAVFILSLEEDVASLLLRGLTDEELRRITAEIAGLGVVENEAVEAVIREYRELERLRGVVREGGLEQAARLLERSLPREKARRIAQLLAADGQGLPFAFLDDAPTDVLLACLQEEHPQTIALVLAHSSPPRAAEVLQGLAPDLRQDILERIASLEGTSSEVLERLQRSLRKHLEAARFESLGEAGGVRVAADILRAAGGGGAAILDRLRERRPELAEEISKRLFAFEHLATLDDRSLQAVLKEIDTRRLALALKDSSDAVRRKVFGNLSRRSAETLREEMEYLGPVRFHEVEAARRVVLETVVRLEEQGVLYISGRGREEDRLVY